MMQESTDVSLDVLCRNKSKKGEADMNNIKNIRCNQCEKGCSIENLRCGKGRKYFAVMGTAMEGVQNDKHGDEERVEKKRGEHSRGKGAGRRHDDREDFGKNGRKHGRAEHAHAGRERHVEIYTGRGQEDEGVEGLFAFIAHKLHHKKRAGKESQRKVLALLAEREWMSQKELQDMLDIQAGSLSELLGKLENRDLIVREKSGEDKRASILKITEKGMEKMRTRETREREYKDLFAVLSPEERESLTVILNKLKQAIWRREGE